MIKLIKRLQKKINYFLYKSLSSKELILNIKVKVDKINFFLELKNIENKQNFLWSGDWDNKKIDLSNYRRYSPSYNSVFQIYKENIHFTKSEEFKLKSNLINRGKKSGRGTNLGELNNYFVSLDKLKVSLKKFGYKSQIELNNAQNKNDEIGVVIGKNWELVKLQDKFGGTHRFALCKILNINEVTVSVKAIHQALLDEKDIKMILNSNNNETIKSFLQNKIISNI